MTQIKVFKHPDMEVLENNVNKWLKENSSEYTIQSVQNSHVTNSKESKHHTTYVTTVMFNDKKTSVGTILHG